jgi:hypothetical protein
VLLVLGVGGLSAFAVWQFTGIEHYLNALGGFCMEIGARAAAGGLQIGALKFVLST